MLNFFRKIRKRLANENKFQRYFRYAFGEILLVVIGILIALQVNNWSQNRTKEQQYQASLEQLYNSLKKVVWNAEFISIYTSQQIQIIDQLLTYSDSIPDKKLLPILYYLETGHDVADLSEIEFDFSLLKDVPGNNHQKELSRLIANFISSNMRLSLSEFDGISSLLASHGIAQSQQAFGLDAMDNFSSIETEFFIESEIEKAKSIVNSQIIKTNLRTLKALKNTFLFDSNNIYFDGITILNKIEEYYPKIRLLYNDIGIIGTAIDGYDDVDGIISTPMKLVNSQKSIWEIDLLLKNGNVKFRNADSWSDNWGYNIFNSGKLVYYGENIPVEAGNFHVTLNLSDNTYEFQKLGD